MKERMRIRLLVVFFGVLVF